MRVILVIVVLLTMLVTPHTVSANTFGAETLRSINKLRVQHHRAKLVSNSVLREAAVKHSRWMAAHSLLRHSNLSAGGSRWYVGEVIAVGRGLWGFPTVLVHRWATSPGHRAVLLGNFSAVGIGVVWRNGKWWYTVIVGRRT